MAGAGAGAGVTCTGLILNRCAACHMSYVDCCASHNRASPPRSIPSHASMRKAISGEIAAWPLITREKTTRDTPSWAAACVTFRLRAGKTSSRRVRPGWGGLCMRVIFIICDLRCLSKRYCVLVLIRLLIFKYSNQAIENFLHNNWSRFFNKNSFSGAPIQRL